jgi:hypothetical protein
MQNGEARRLPRLKTIKSGQVIVDSSGTSVDCAIRNISASGALIRFDSPVELPETVELIILSHDIQVGANVAWQNGTEAGVEFAPGAVDD